MAEKKAFWEMASRPGRPLNFPTPTDLWEACVEYFEWTKDNPIQEEDLFAYQGEVTRETIDHPRAMTLGALCAFIGMPRSGWSEYREKDGFSEVTTRADEIIREQKFTGAAAGLLKENIIAREMGLADKKEVAVDAKVQTTLYELPDNGRDKED